MARKTRTVAHSGIYHVMLRGINKQNIFLDENDFDSLLSAMREVQCQRDERGEIIHTRNCTYYAYCILHNHVHILVKEGELGLSELMKRIQNRFVYIYNHKYDRVGHLFQDRFASEPVDDLAYFKVLLRYIHRNPVKAMEAQTPEDYRYSSWLEYLSVINGRIKGSDPLMRPLLCDVGPSIKRFGAEELVAWVNMSVDDKCMDMDTFFRVVREEDAANIILELSDTENIEYFKQLSPELQIEYIRQAMLKGVSLRQAARLSSLTYRKLWNTFHPEEYEEEKRKRREEKMAKRKAKMSASRGLTP